MNRKGFTLIELIMVIVVIAILVGAALPRFGGMQDEAFRTKAASELRTLQIAIESYYSGQKPPSYPDSTTDIVADYLVFEKPQIVQVGLYDPFAAEGEEYIYYKSENGRYYVVFSIGMDGQADITGIADNGELDGAENDDLFATNGYGWEGP